MLTDAQCRQAVPGDKERKLTDAHGLYLRVSPSGTKSWCWKYRFGDREKRLTIGPYPLISLKAARASRDAARAQLLAGIDPSEAKRKEKQRISIGESFEEVAKTWFEAKEKSLTPRYAKQVWARLEQNAFKYFRNQPIQIITPAMVLDVVRRIEARGAITMAHEVRAHISDIFVWAIAAGLAEQDPAATIRKALKPQAASRRPAQLKLAAAQALLKAIEKSKTAHWATLLASRLTALTAARPGVVRLAERGEFEGLDGTEPVWRIPAGKMKLSAALKQDARMDFVVPLSCQAVAVVQTAMKASQSDQWLFPGVGSWRKPISDSTLSKLYRESGFTDRHVPHGWRATFSTIMNELAGLENRPGDREVIDLMLAHIKGDVEAAYNRAAYMPRRRELAQAWADMLMAGLPTPETLLP
jgi:integrase